VSGCERKAAIKSVSGCERKADAKRKRARSVSAIARNIKRSAQPQETAQPAKI
jgi:hypothetical protein